MEKKTEHQDFKKPKLETSNRRKQNKPVQWTVSSATFFMLRVSRLVGIAPVRFDGHLVSVSHPVYIFSLVAIVAIDVLYYIRVYMEYALPHVLPSIWPTSFVGRFVDIGSATLALLSVTISIYKSPRRIEKILQCMDQIQKFHSNDSKTKNVWEEQKKRAYIFIFVSTGWLIVGVNYCFLTSQKKNTLKMDYQIIIIAVLYLFTAMIVQYQAMQFIFTAFEVKTALKSLNKVLEKVGRLVKKQDEKPLPSYQITKIFVNSIRNKNNALKITNYGVLGITASQAKLLKPEAIHRLVIEYYQLFGIVRQMSECFGPELLGIVTLFVLHLITGPLVFIAWLASNVFDLHLGIMHSLFCSWYLISTFAVVEPCHRTQKEMDKSKLIVSHLIMKTRDHLVRDELKKLSRFLTLNGDAYSPMKAWTLSRSFIFSMLRSVLSYFIIVVQFQIVEQSKKANKQC